ncbi:hypothetical protein LCGC14_1961610 [marine sediment metagenome]|uniref:Uncharacterized protein n=1 Tax=marine sediment metagenome TaxID=412755 RepID=A0A0F9G2V3_9ZZZZ
MINAQEAKELTNSSLSPFQYWTLKISHQIERNARNGLSILDLEHMNINSEVLHKIWIILEYHGYKIETIGSPKRLTVVWE